MDTSYTEKDELTDPEEAALHQEVLREAHNAEPEQDTSRQLYLPFLSR